MTAEELQPRLRQVCAEPMPLPGRGQTAGRHRRLMEIGRENLSLARLAEAHFDAIAILAENGRSAAPGAIYGVWASERPDHPVLLDAKSEQLLLSGTKMFCSGAGIIDRTLVTVEGPDPLLIDLDLRSNANAVRFDSSNWKPNAFVQTNTATVSFSEARASRACVIGDRGWYLRRPGFWHGALGPAACWAGGAVGIADYVRTQSRSDPHTLAHKGAILANAWSMQTWLEVAGNEIDASPDDCVATHRRALTVRHLIEQSCSEILQRFGRAYGPHPLALVEEISTRCQELTIYIRQSHAERDLASLGELVGRLMHDGH